MVSSPIIHVITWITNLLTLEGRKAELADTLWTINLVML